jgi:hypothetical protein
MDAGTVEALLETSNFAAQFAAESPVSTAEGPEAVEAERVDATTVRP